MEITSQKVLEQLIQEWGFLPFFENEIPGFSIEEHTPRRLWFSDTADGPWEWKGPIARKGNCVYGKFFWKKAGFLSLDWFPDFANYRRDGYDFDARFDDDLAPLKDKQLYDVLSEHGSLMTDHLRDLCNYRKGGNKGFETVITRLQMQTYVNISDFRYRTTKAGKQYGWGVALYSTPEKSLGEELLTAGYARQPAESKERIFTHLKKLLPKAEEKAIWRLIG